MQGLKGMAQITTDIVVHKRFVDGPDVLTWEAHPDAHCQIRSAQLAFDQPIDGIWASDRFAVLAELEIGMNQSAACLDQRVSRCGGSHGPGSS